MSRRTLRPASRCLGRRFTSRRRNRPRPRGASNISTSSAVRQFVQLPYRFAVLIPTPCVEARRSQRDAGRDVARHPSPVPARHGWQRIAVALPQGPSGHGWACACTGTFTVRSYARGQARREKRARFSVVVSGNGVGGECETITHLCCGTVVPGAPGPRGPTMPVPRSPCGTGAERQRVGTR